MGRRVGVALAASALVVATSGTSVARSAVVGCPQLTDPRGDVVFKKQVTDSFSPDAVGGWDERSLDILSASVSSDAHYVTTTVRVGGLTDDAVHSYEWDVWLEPETSHPGEKLETWARWSTGGQRYGVHREYRRTDTPMPGAGHPTQSDAAPATGSIDLHKGLIQVRIPVSSLAAWNIPGTARIWDLYATSSSVLADVGGPEQSLVMVGGGAGDESSHVRFRGHLNDPGCAP